MGGKERIGIPVGATRKTRVWEARNAHLFDLFANETTYKEHKTNKKDGKVSAMRKAPKPNSVIQTLALHIDETLL